MACKAWHVASCHRPAYRSAAPSTLPAIPHPHQMRPVQGAETNPYHAVVCRRGRFWHEADITSCATNGVRNIARRIGGNPDVQQAVGHLPGGRGWRRSGDSEADGAVEPVDEGTHQLFGIERSPRTSRNSFGPLRRRRFRILRLAGNRVGQSVDSTLVALVISYDHMPTGSPPCPAKPANFGGSNKAISRWPKTKNGWQTIAKKYTVRVQTTIGMATPSSRSKRSIRSDGIGPTSQRSRLRSPAKIRQLFDDAGLGGLLQTATLRRQIARFLHKHKVDDFTDYR
jgi:hypothetical protein